MHLTLILYTKLYIILQIRKRNIILCFQPELIFTFMNTVNKTNREFSNEKKTLTYRNRRKCWYIELYDGCK